MYVFWRQKIITISIIIMRKNFVATYPVAPTAHGVTRTARSNDNHSSHPHGQWSSARLICLRRRRDPRTTAFWIFIASYYYYYYNFTIFASAKVFEYYATDGVKIFKTLCQKHDMICQMLVFQFFKSAGLTYDSKCYENKLATTHFTEINDFWLFQELFSAH